MRATRSSSRSAGSPPLRAASRRRSTSCASRPARTARTRKRPSRRPPLRNVFETDRRFLTSARGAIALRAPPSACSPPPSARQICSPISEHRVEPPPPPRLLPRPAVLAGEAERPAGVRETTHRVTAFRKQVFPRLARPAPTLRTEGQRVEKCGRTRVQGVRYVVIRRRSPLTPSSSRRSRDSPRGGWPFASARVLPRVQDDHAPLRLLGNQGGSARLRSERSRAAAGRNAGRPRSARARRASSDRDRKVSARRRRRRDDTRHHERCSVLLGRGGRRGSPGDTRVDVYTYLARTNESLRRGGSTSRSRGANGDGLARLPIGADGRLSATRFGRSNHPNAARWTRVAHDTADV